MAIARRKADCCPGNGCRPTVNRRLLPIKATYFFAFAAAAVLHPYIPVYMKELRLTPRETAIILTLTNALSAVARAVIGALADVVNKHAIIMIICCLIAAPAHFCLYFTPPVDRNDATCVTHHLAASLFCSDGRMAICVTQDTRNDDDWNDLKVEKDRTGIQNMSHEVREQGGEGSKMKSSCNIRCCSAVDSSSRSGYRTPTSEQATHDLASFRKDGQQTKTTVRPTSEYESVSSSTASSSTESHEQLTVTMMSDSANANLSRNCQSFTNLTLSSASWNLTSSAEDPNCTSVWIFDQLGNVTGAVQTCNYTKRKYSSCTLECYGFNPYSGSSEECEYGNGDEAQYGPTFVIFFVLFFIAIFFCSPVYSIADSFVYAVLGDNGKDFGQVRLWGTVALGLFALLSGLAMDALKEVGVENVYLYPFITSFVCWLITASTSFCIPTVKKPKLPIPVAGNLTSPLVSLQVIGMSDLKSSTGSVAGKSPSLVTLGYPHPGQLGVALVDEPRNGFGSDRSSMHKSKNPGDIRGSITLISQRDLGELGNLVTLKSSSSEDLKIPVAHKSQSEWESADAAALKSPESSSSSSSMCGNFVLLLSNPIIVIVFVTILTSGIILGQHDAFFFWYLKTLGASQLLLGLIIVVMCVSEVALLFISGRILQVVGYRGCLYLIFAVYSVRLLVNSFIWNPWAALGTEMTQSLCISILFPAASLSVNELAPPGMHGTVQGIIAALHWSIGKAIGSAIAGVLYEITGPQRMFQIFSCVSFVYGVLLAVTLETYCRWKPRKKTETDEDLELKVSLKAPVEPPQITGSDEPESNHWNDNEASSMMLDHQQQHQPPQQH